MGLFRHLAALAFVFLLGASAVAPAAAAEPHFPALTGRIVDDAHLFSIDTREALTAKLKDFEEKSGIQLVVATAPTLEGWEIEPYANQLFRNWRLGQAQKNNGVLLLVAPYEHKVRIEVGYGLEGTLADATSKLIIVNAMAPRFKAGDFNGGVTRGVDDIITTLSTDASSWQTLPVLRAAEDVPYVLYLALLAPIAFIGIFVFLFIRLARINHGFRNALRSLPANNQSPRSRSARATSSAWSSSSSSESSSSSSSSSSSDSFSGGGGDSGGGGASGSW